MSDTHDEVAKYQAEAADEFNVNLVLKATGDGSFDALEGAMPAKSQSSTSPRVICTRPTRLEAARDAVEILRRRASH